MAISRGLFIVLEGLDRSGKSTQCKKLVESLLKSGFNSQLQSYPDRSEPETGEIIDNFLKTAKSPYEKAEEIHVLFSKNRRNIDSELRKRILNGITIVADRYSFSGIAYTAAKDVPAKFACETEVGLLKPDIVIYLDADPTETAKRAGFGEEALEKLDFQQKVNKEMKKLFNESYWIKVDAIAPVEEVHKSIEKVIIDLMNKPRSELKSFELSDFNCPNSK